MIRRTPPFLLIASLGAANAALAGPIDLSSFDTIDPTVSLYGPDNSSALIQEDPALAPVGLWALDLPIPADADALHFAFDLRVATGNEDYFDFYFGDLTAPSLSFGGLEASADGTLSESLLPYRGGTLAIAFALSYGFGDGGLASVLTIEEVRIATASVPVPSMTWLLGAGLLAWRLSPRRRTTS